MTAVNLGCRHPGLLLLQDRDDLLFAEPAPLHIRPTPSRRTLLKIGHISGEHVRTKRRLREELDQLCDFHGYIGFEADPRDYGAHIVGQSFLYDVPATKRGWLSRFRGQRVRVICLYSGAFRRWLRVGTVPNPEDDWRRNATKGVR